MKLIMANKPDVWNFRQNLEDKVTDIAVANSKLSAHLENIYHHIKRIDKHLEKQNGSIARHDNIIYKYKGIAIGMVIILSGLQVVIAMIIH